MSTPLRESALAAVATRLAAQIPTATVERARRAPVDLDNEALPLLVLTGGDMSADETSEPGATHYTLSLAIAGYARARTDLAAEQAVTALHAQVVAALAGWEPAIAGIGNTAEEGAEFEIYDAEASKAPAGTFAARFSILLIAATGNPYTA
jgi:hypothetical protein